MGDTVKQNNTENKFPFIRLFVCSCLGGFLTYIRSYNFINETTVVYNIPFIITFAYTFILCLIPMLIAYKRNTTNKEAIYWLTFLLPIPFGTILYISALLLSIFSKSNNRAVSKSDNIGTKEYKTKSFLYKFKLNNIITKSLNLKIIIFILLFSFLGIFCYFYTDNRVETLKLKIYNECMNENDSFFNNMEDEIKYELSKTDRLENLRNKLNLSCECESKAIVSATTNPYTKLKYMKSIAASYNHWESYYKKNNSEFYNNYIRNKRSCIKTGKMPNKSIISTLSSEIWWLKMRMGQSAFDLVCFCLVIILLIILIKFMNVIFGRIETKKSDTNKK